ncbi:hypothetical protein LTR09_004302 [Extremus antarcticus]|uniref:Uncharacterized protein n=1 Tax=Extremus antarcticus TaxID=702011 RepID=A0AAJ0GDW2_9PEZI|nr:hypothetical protein LTR09_004302 [Extremus antarcticus]
MSPLEMVLKSSRYLEPWLYLGFQVYKVGFSIVFAVLEIVEYAQQQWILFAEGYRYLEIVLIAVAVVMVYGFVKEQYQDDDESTHMASGAMR